MSIDPFSIIGVIIVIILALTLGKLLKATFKIAFYVLLVALIFIFFFGVSYNELVTFIGNIMLWAF